MNKTRNKGFDKIKASKTKLLLQTNKIKTKKKEKTNEYVKSTLNKCITVYRTFN